MGRSFRTHDPKIYSRFIFDQKMSNFKCLFVCLFDSAGYLLPRNYFEVREKDMFVDYRHMDKAWDKG